MIEKVSKEVDVAEEEERRLPAGGGSADESASKDADEAAAADQMRVGPARAAFVDRPLLFVIAASTLFFLYFYAGHPSRPGASFPLGWFGWYDQGQYLVEARAIREGLLDPKLYQYPLGYPFIGSLFLRLTPSDPFIIPNLIAFISAVGLFFKISERYFGTVVATLGSVLLILATPLTTHTVVPWTTTPVLLAVTFWAYIALTREGFGYLVPAFGGGMLALTFAARGGGEILFLLPLGGVLLWRFRREEKLALKVLLLFAVFAVGLAINLNFTEKIFGSFFHPYFRAVLVRGFHLSRVPSSLWGALIYSGNEGEFWNPLLRDGFWLTLAPFGFVMALIKAERKPVHLAILIGLVTGLLVTAAFPAFNAEHLKYHALHYIKIWFPVAGFYALYGVMSILPFRDVRCTGG